MNVRDLTGQNNTEKEEIKTREWAQLRNRCFSNMEITMEDWEKVMTEGSSEQKYYINQFKLVINANKND
jgi:hypothetical protein